MNIVLCADHKFVMPCGVLICSICMNNKNSIIHFYIITDDSLTNEDKADIENILTTTNPQTSIVYLYVLEKFVQKISWYKNNYYPKQIFYRLFMSELLPDDVDKVIYLDCDIIVRKSIEELWRMPLNDNYVGIVPDGGSGSLETYNRLQYSIELGYFNSGVMLVNIAQWRKDDIFQKILNYIEDNKNSIVLGDQDPMNYLFRCKKVHVPMKYNVQPSFLYLYKYMSFSIYQYKEELDEARKNPVVLHFAGCRPWEKGCNHPYKEEFFKYQSKTKWKDTPLIKVNRSCSYYVKEFSRKILTPFGICHYVSDYFDRNII